MFGTNDRSRQCRGRRGPRPRAVLGVVAALALTVLLTDCTGPSKPSYAPPEKANITIAAVPAVDSVGLYIADQMGFFAQQGLKATIVPAISSQTVLSDQKKGEYDVTVGNYVSYVQAQVGGAKLRIIAEGSVMAPSTQVVVVPPGSPIKTVAGLKGKRIGVNVTNNIGTLLVSALLADNGMKASDVKFVAIKFPDMAAALSSHAVDAAWLPEPFVTEVESSTGADVLADINQGAVHELPISGAVVTDAWAQRYPNTLAAVQRALNQGQVYASQHHGAVEKAMVAYTNLKPEAAALMNLDTYPTGVDRIRLQRIPDLMYLYGMLPRRFNIATMLLPTS